MSRHRDLQELLPWFVNGTLDAREQSVVNEHLEACEECRREVRVLVETSKLFVPDMGLADAGEAVCGAAARGESMTGAEFIGRLTTDEVRAQSPRWRLPVAALVCLLVLSVFVSRFEGPADGFETRSSGADERGPVIQLVFRPETPERDIRELLLRDGSRFVSGPTAGGVYRIALAGDADPVQVLRRLREHSHISFAELE